MQKIIKKAFQALLFVPILALGVSAVVPAANAQAQSPAACDQTKLTIGSGASCARGEEQSDDLFGETGIFRTITNILLFLVGAISVIMLIIGGIRYVVSNGDQSAVTGAKNTILYAIIGIIVAFLAYAAVQFVTTQLVKGAS